jgi:transposase
VDDWARRKGRTYAAIVCDLERHRPLDLLPDATAATWAAWLKAHPTVQVVSRDRGQQFAEVRIEDDLCRDRKHSLPLLGAAHGLSAA